MGRQALKGHGDRRARGRGPRCYDLLSLNTPKDRIGRAVRQAQIDALIRLVPATVAIQILTAAVMVVGLRDTTDNFQLGMWFGAALLLCFTRGVRAVRLRLAHQSFTSENTSSCVTVHATQAMGAASTNNHNI